MIPTPLRKALTGNDIDRDGKLLENTAYLETIGFTKEEASRLADEIATCGDQWKNILVIEKDEELRLDAKTFFDRLIGRNEK